MNKIINLDNVQLSKSNPRFSRVNSLSSKLSLQILSDYEKYDEVQSIKDLLLREGDYTTLLDLIKSIKIAGFDATSDRPIFIKTLTGKFVVAEGNRRVMVMLMVLKPEYINLIIENQTDLNESEYLQSEEYKSQRSNIKEIKSLFQHITYKKEWFEANKTVDIFNEDKDNPGQITDEEDDKLWAMIYTKHISGDRPGLRRWPRGKYFIDILAFFPANENANLDEEDLQRKSFSKLKRSFETLKEDLKQARFCFDVIAGAENDEIKAIEIMRSKKVSSLQSNFSISYMRLAFKNIFGNTKKFKNYVDMKFDKTTATWSYGGIISKSDLFDFIYKWWDNKVVTTRGINRTEDALLYNDALISLVMKYSIDDDIKNMTAKNLMQADLKMLEETRDNQRDSESKKAIGSLVRIKVNTLMASKIISEYPSQTSGDDEFNIFSYLKNQFEHNKEKFPGAEAITLRSFNEQMWIWLPYFNAYVFDKMMDSADKDLDFDDDIDREKYLDKFLFSNEKVSDILWEVRKIIQSRIDSLKTDDEKIIEIRNIFKLILNDKIGNEDILSIYKKEGFGNILNSYVHSLHRQIGASGFIEPVEKFNIWYSKMLRIINSFKPEFIHDVKESTKRYME